MKKNGKILSMGNGECIKMVSDNVSDSTKKSALAKNKKDIDAKTKAWNDELEKRILEGKTKEEELQTLEIMPSMYYILVQPYPKNPYQKIEVSETGIITSLDNAPKQVNTDEGVEEDAYNLSKVARVIEVGPLVKYVRAGDDVFFRLVSAVPVPFFRQGFEVIAESQVQAVVNAGLKKRFESIK